MDKSKINPTFAGLHKDLYNKSYPQGAYTFALNSVNETDKGDFSTISTEKGTLNCGNIPEGYFPQGSVFTGKEHIVFLYNIDTQESELGLIDIDCNYTEVINADCLNFSKPIQAVFRIINGCERVVYFCDDGNNVDRSINIDEILNNPTDNKYIEDNKFNCDLIGLKPLLSIPCIDDIKVFDTGGSLKIGMYQVFIKYETTSGDKTAVVAESPVFPIIQGNYNDDYNGLTGGDPALTPITSKSFNIILNDVDEGFAYINIIIGYTENGLTTFYNLGRSEITGNSITKLITSLTASDVFEIDRGEITQTVNPYDSSKTMVQHDNRLIRGNVRSKIFDYAAFQREANNIQVKYKWKKVKADDPNSSSGSVKTPAYYIHNKSYMRDEIYSLGIVWVRKDGSTLPVMHIPGRELNKRADGTPLPPLSASSDFVSHSRPNKPDSGNGWDDALFNTKDNDITLPDLEHIAGINDLNQIERWKFCNTAKTDTFENLQPTENEGTGQMAYWESLETYPSTVDCNGDRIFPEGNIRHHRFPDTTLEPHFYEDPDTLEEYIKPIGFEITNVKIPTGWDGELQGFYIVREKRTEGNKSVIDKGLMFAHPYFRYNVAGAECEAKNYSIQSNFFNKHMFRLGQVFDERGVKKRHGVAIEWGLLPNGSSIDTNCGSINFENFEDITKCDDNGNVIHEGDNDASLLNTKRFIDYDTSSQCFHSPLTKFRGNTYNEASHIKVEGRLNADPEQLFCQRWCQDMDNLCEDEKPINRRRWAAEFLKFDRWTQLFSTIITEGNTIVLSGESVPSGLIADPIRRRLHRTNRQIKTNIKIGVGQEVGDNLLRNPFINTSAQELLLLEFNDGDEYKLLNSTDSMKFKKWKPYKPTFDNWFIPTGPCSDDTCGKTGSQLLCGGGIHPNESLNCAYTGSLDINRVSGLYTSVKAYLPTIYGRIGNSIYKKASSCIHKSENLSENDTFTIFGGDTFISKFSYFSSSYDKFCTRRRANIELFMEQVDVPGCIVYEKGCAKYVDAKDDADKNDHSAPFSIVKALTSFYVESEINTELRHVDNTQLDQLDNTYWPYANFVSEWDKNEYMELSNDSYKSVCGDSVDCGTEVGVHAQWVCGTFAQNRYYYNDDFSDENETIIYTPISELYDYCKDCLEEYPTRIVYSQPGYQEDITDSYRLFLTLNYRDIPGNTGEITNLFVTYDQLYAHTERSLFHIYTKAQQIQTNLSTLYIGTGDFFSIPPQEKINTHYAYGGSTEQFATIVTENGAFFIDSETSKIFTLGAGEKGTQLQEISSVGLRNYFEEDGLKVEIKEYLIDKLGAGYSNIESFVEIHTGFITTYDPRHKRLIITKKDYKYIERRTPPGQIQDPIYDVITGPRIDFNNPDYFEDLSWTMSYSLITGGWLSWHSYKPDYYLNDGNDYFSMIDHRVWKHNVGNYSTYYNNKYSQILEIPIFGPKTKALNSLAWIAETEEYDTVTRQYRTLDDVTFTSGEVYNTYQTTGSFDIIPKTSDFQNVLWNNTSKVAVFTDKNWRLSGLRDLTITDNTTISTSEWNNPNFQNVYLQENFIDRVTNPSVYDATKSLYELGDMRDKVNYVRLFFKPDNNYNHIVFMLNSFNNENVR